MLRKIVLILLDLVRAIRMRFSQDAQVRAAGLILAREVFRRLLAWLLVPMAMIQGALALLVAVLPPYGPTMPGFLVLAAVSLWLAFPVPMANGDTWKLLLVRCAGFVVVVLVTGVLLATEKEDFEASLTPQQRERRQSEAQAREQEQERNEAQRRREERENEAQRRNAQRERELAADVRKENANQRDFYDQLGAPKLLYKCKSSPLETAIGAKFGTFNRLLDEASNRCAVAGGIEVLKRKE